MTGVEGKNIVKKGKVDSMVYLLLCGHTEWLAKRLPEPFLLLSKGT